MLLPATQASMVGKKTYDEDKFAYVDGRVNLGGSDFQGYATQV